MGLGPSCAPLVLITVQAAPGTPDFSRVPRMLFLGLTVPFWLSLVFFWCVLLGFFRHSAFSSEYAFFSISMSSTANYDLLNPPAAIEAKSHKLKRLVQSPNSFFMDVKCPGCYQITTMFSHASSVVACATCATILCQPTGGKAQLTEGCHFRKKGPRLLLWLAFRDDRGSTGESQPAIQLTSFERARNPMLLCLKKTKL
eukprot:g82464.t1